VIVVAIVLSARFFLPGGIVKEVGQVQSSASKGNFPIGVFYSGGSSKLCEVKAAYRKELEL
jgi:hypothetical protein